jgi:hypothetical protein
LSDEWGLCVPIIMQPIAAATRQRAGRWTDAKPWRDRQTAEVASRSAATRPKRRAENKPLAIVPTEVPNPNCGPGSIRVSASHYPIRVLLKATPPSQTPRGLINKTAGLTRARGFFLRALRRILNADEGDSPPT